MRHSLVYWGQKIQKEEIEMAFAVWWGILNLVLTAALLAAVVYLFVLIVRALKKYIGSREVRGKSRL